MSETTLRRTLPEAYRIGIVRTASYWAFLEGGAGVVCAAYAGGTYLEDVAETAELTLQLNERPVLHQSRHLILSSEAGDRIEVWDVAANVVSNYTPAGGKVVVGACGLGGSIYWMEFAETDWIAAGLGWQSTVNLRQADLDLGSLATIASVTLDQAFHWQWRGLAANPWFALTPTSAIAERVAEDAVASEIFTHFRVRMTLDAEEEQSADLGSGGGTLLKVGIPESSGGALALAEGFLHRVPDAVDGAVAGHWPASGAWALDSAKCCSTTPAGDEVAVYGTVEDGGRLLRHGAAAPEGGTPNIAFDVDEHPEHGTPALFFIYEPEI